MYFNGRGSKNGTLGPYFVILAIKYIILIFLIVKNNIMSDWDCCVLNRKNTSKKQYKFCKLPVKIWKISQRYKWIAFIFITTLMMKI